ncbi:unnamed protein product [Ixodes persulcatus]
MCRRRSPFPMPMMLIVVPRTLPEVLSYVKRPLPVIISAAANFRMLNHLKKKVAIQTLRSEFLVSSIYQNTQIDVCTVHVTRHEHEISAIFISQICILSAEHQILYADSIRLLIWIITF